jgi:hypothetical protein
VSWYGTRDVKSEPVDGKVFPVRFNRVVQQCKALPIKHYCEKRIPITFRNLKSKTLKEDDWILAVLHPTQRLTVFSVPDTFDGDIAANALSQCLVAFAVLNTMPFSYHASLTERYQGYLMKQAELELCHATFHWKLRKYRGAQKFSGSGGAKPTKSDYRRFVLDGTTIGYR